MEELEEDVEKITKAKIEKTFSDNLLSIEIYLEFKDPYGQTDLSDFHKVFDKRTDRLSEMSTVMVMF